MLGGFLSIRGGIKLKRIESKVGICMKFFIFFILFSILLLSNAIANEPGSAGVMSLASKGDEYECRSNWTIKDGQKYGYEEDGVDGLIILKFINNMDYVSVKNQRNGVETIYTYDSFTKAPNDFFHIEKGEESATYMFSGNIIDIYESGEVVAFFNAQNPEGRPIVTSLSCPRLRLNIM